MIAAPKTDYYVFALLDVLGFSSWLSAKGLQAIAESYCELINKAVLAPGSQPELGSMVTPPGNIFAVNSPPNYSYLSDTLMIWFPLSGAMVGGFVSRCADLMCEAIDLGIPLRGAITIGEAAIDVPSGIYLGTPIIEAHSLEKKQNWIGVTFGESCMWSPFFAQVPVSSVMEYEVPVKDCGRTRIVLDWPRQWTEKGDRTTKELLDRLRRLKEEWCGKDTSVHRYWDNTIKFVEYSDELRGRSKGSKGSRVGAAC